MCLFSNRERDCFNSFFIDVSFTTLHIHAGWYVVNELTLSHIPDKKDAIIKAKQGYDVNEIIRKKINIVKMCLRMHK